MRIAAAQLTCAPADIEANARQAADLAARAVAEGAEVIVFPELTLTGYELSAIAADPTLWTPPTDPRLDALRTAGIVTVINCAAPGDHGPVIATFVHGPDGELLTRYHKQHLYKHEQAVFTPGFEDGRFEFGGLRFSLATCYDNHFPDLTARAADCDVHLASSLYGTGGGIHERATVYPRIAHDSNVFVALANHVGPAGPWTGCGGAAIWAPGGRLLQECDTTTPGIVTATVG